MYIKIAITMLFMLLSPQMQSSIVLSTNQSNSNLWNRITTTQNVAGSLYQGFGNTPATVLGASYINGSIGGDLGVGSVNDQINALGIQSDGKIVVAGYCNAHDQDNNERYFTLARFLPTGQLDSSFGVSGTQGALRTIIPGTVTIAQSICGTDITTNAISDTITALVIQSDDKIVVTGSTLFQTDIAGETYCALARFMPDGTLDTSFGVTGTIGAVTTLIPGTVFINQSIAKAPFTSGFASDAPYAIALQGDEKIVISGVTYAYDDSHGARYCMIARFMPNGTLDNSFGVAGTVGNVTSFIPGTVFISNSISGIGSDTGYIDDIGNAVAVQPDGKIVFAGYTQGYNNDMTAVLLWMVGRFLPNGELDDSFGAAITSAGLATTVTGTVYFPQGITGTPLIPLEYPFFNYIAGISLQADEKIVVAGPAAYYHHDGAYSAYYFGAARFMPNGTLDPSFGVAGSGAKTVIPGTVFIGESLSGTSLETRQIEDVINAMALQNDGKLVVGGYTKYYTLTNQAYYFAVARFMENGAIDPSFGVNGTGTATLIPGTCYISESISGTSFDSGNINDKIAALAISFDGKIITGGQTDAVYDGFNQYFALAEFYNPLTFMNYKNSYSKVGAALNC